MAELEMQLKELSAEKDVLAEELKKREYAIGEFKGIIAKLESEIAGFKAYI